MFSKSKFLADFKTHFQGFFNYLRNLIDCIIQQPPNCKQPNTCNKSWEKINPSRVHLFIGENSPSISNSAGPLWRNFWSIIYTNLSSSARAPLMKSSEKPEWIIKNFGRRRKSDSRGKIFRHFLRLPNERFCRLSAHAPACEIAFELN